MVTIDYVSDLVMLYEHGVLDYDEVRGQLIAENLKCPACTEMDTDGEIDIVGLEEAVARLDVQWGPQCGLTDNEITIEMQALDGHPLSKIKLILHEEERE